MKLQFRRFQTRIIVLFLGLFTLVQVVAFVSVYAVQLTSARAQINSALELGAGVFNKLIKERNARLIEAAKLLSGDFAFKSVYATHTQETDTILSALLNHQLRIDADVMMMVSLSGVVIADTLGRDTHGKPFMFPHLIRAAEKHPYGEASSIIFIEDRAYQMVVVPLLVPQPDAWICIGFLLDDRFAAELEKLTLSHVSLLREKSVDYWSVVASTLPQNLRQQAANHLVQGSWEEQKSVSIRLGDGDYVSLVSPLDNTPEGHVVAMLQRSLDEALKPVTRLMIILTLLAVTGLGVSLVIGILIARSVTRPVLVLAENARKIERGEYGQHVNIRQQDEIGELAAAFNRMARGLEEKDRIRDLLGKVVSPAIAQQLLSKQIELGGAGLEATILFADVRNFTGLCENRSPAEVLSLLNTYLTRISAVIDANGGVVDKYIGDAVMALFGAPLAHEDDPARAINTALGMHRVLRDLNLELEQQGMPQLDIGIGINTAMVVAGNMGSPTRMNYTVIGDGVNLASRLEVLTKRYNVPIIVSETTMIAAPGFVYRELDKVRVKGKNRSVMIYQPLGLADAVDVKGLIELEQYHAALKSYRQRDLAQARVEFARLRALYPGSRLYQIYEGYIEHFSKTAMNHDWDGSFVLYEK